MTVYEQKLIKAGINVKTELGKNLLDAMIEGNYSEDIEITIMFEHDLMLEGTVHERDHDTNRSLYWNHPENQKLKPLTDIWSIDEYYYEGFNGSNGWDYNLYPGTLSSPDDWKRVDR